MVIGEFSLDLEAVAAVADGAEVSLSLQAEERVARARACVDRWVQSDIPVYGVTTGFGALAEVRVPADQLLQLQHNLILSHAAGVGEPLSQRETRAMMLLRANTLAQGNSGARPELLHHLVGMLNGNVHPLIPGKGSVGASGDLAPLAHLALGMIGHGRAELEGRVMPAAQALEQVGMHPITLQAKEGLCLINGTQTMAAVGGLALLDADRLANLADIAGAMTLEGLNGLPQAFDERIQACRPHKGQGVCAANLRRLVAGSSSGEGALQVQDPYSLRCMPQVHGASRDTFEFVRSTITCEMNSATDNPLVFAEDDVLISGGNFHGQPIAMGLDFAAIALAELGNISERRVEQLVNPALSGLPPFLVPKSGIHSGYMMAQVTAAALVNENKLMANPASTDSIPGSASREDHVSMGMTSARKLREIVINTNAILAVEILCAAQAIDLRKPMRMGAGTAAAYATVREVVPHLEEDRLLANDIEAIIALVRRGGIQKAVLDALGSASIA